MVGCQKEPIATISADKTSVETGEAVKFSNTTTDAKSYKWDFGDGSASTEASPSKTFSKAGTYTVKMTAYSKNGKKSDEATSSITVKDINAKFAGTYNVTETGTTEFCGSYTNTYTMTVTVNGTNEIVMNNFAGGFNNIKATVSGSSITIPAHNGVYDSEGVQWDINSGSGTLSANKLSFSFNMDDILYDYNCGEGNVSVTGTK